MDTCRGLTIVPHEDLSKAINNWNKAKKLWKSYEENKSLQRKEIWSNISLVKRFWYKINSGIFTPKEYWCCVDDWCKINFPKELKKGLYQYVAHNGGWWYTQRYTAEECSKHSTQPGTHYLTPEQVVFVSKFKDLY